MKRSTRRPEAAIPTASMADLALLLLIFFLATTLIETQGGPVVALPPAASAADARRENAIVVRVARDRTATVEGRRVALDELGDVIAAARTQRPAARVIVYADRDLECRTVLGAVAALRGPEAIPLVLAVDRESAPPPEEER